MATLARPRENVGVRVDGPPVARADEVLTPDALAFVADLHRRFDADRRALLAEREQAQASYDAGERPDFDPATAAIRHGEWRIAPVPADLQDRRVEITGPTDAKMLINALNSGARVFMADLEDATAPSWTNVVEGQTNLRDRWRGTLAFEDPTRGKSYRMNDDVAVLMVRPRGWHLPERHVTVDGQDVSGALFDFGLYLFHNARAALDAGSGPYFYLPKLESGAEAALWDRVIRHAQDALGLPVGTVKATVLIETITAAFQMDEILHALREHIVGLNCGRWDYIFSYIKRLGNDLAFLTPDRQAMVMGDAFLRAYSLLLIRTCHRRGAHAMGGMAAQIPVKGDEAANTRAFDRVRADKEREAGWGHDGTWVAHPALVPVALEVFDRVMPAPNQLGIVPEALPTRDDLLRVHAGPRTEEGVRTNIRVGVRYIAAWLGGRGAVPLYDLMEDAATAEISRAQLWQWLRHGARLEDGRTVTRALLEGMIEEEVARLDDANLDEARAIFAELVFAERCGEFLTSRSYAALA